MKPCIAAIALAAAAIATPSAHSSGRDVGPVTNDLYAKECGTCHMAYSPAWLPERSWRRIMSTLGNHFNENAELKSGESQRILDYLVANSAERSGSFRSRQVLASLPGGETPVRISKTPYIDGIHGGLLDPVFKGRPHVKTLSECAACHPRANDGLFGPRRYVITDEVFRRPE